MRGKPGWFATRPYNGNPIGAPNVRRIVPHGRAGWAPEPAQGRMDGLFKQILIMVGLVALIVLFLVIYLIARASGVR